MDTRDRLTTMQAILTDDYRHAVTRASLARTMRVTVGQLDSLIYGHADAREVWDRAHAKARADNCAVRRCWSCRKVRPIGEFPHDKTRPCGRGYRCSMCNRLASKLHRQRG